MSGSKLDYLARYTGGGKTKKKKGKQDNIRIHDMDELPPRKKNLLEKLAAAGVDVAIVEDEGIVDDVDTVTSRKRGRSRSQSQETLVLDRKRPPICPRKRELDADISPPRGRIRDYDADLSPPRARIRDSDADLSPPRARIKDSDADLSPPRARIKDSDADLSLPRARIKDSDADLSPPRARIKDSDADLSPPRAKMSSGISAGLQSKEAIMLESDRLKQNSSTAANAETIYRDKAGKKITKEEWQKTSQKPKKKRRVFPEQNLEWGAGLVQKKTLEEEQAEAVKVAAEPLARYEIGAEYDAALQERTRWNDPATRASEVKADKPKCRFPAPPNRFGIVPGYRWDGKLRGNGFEARLFKTRNDRTYDTAMVSKIEMADW